MPNKVHERVWDSFRLLEPGITPLHYVLLRSCPLLKGAQPESLYPGPPNLAIMRELLERGAAPNLATQRSGRTPLMLAAAFGFEEAIELLLEFGAKLEAESKYGERDAAEWADISAGGGRFPELAKKLRNPQWAIDAQARRAASQPSKVANAAAVTTEHG